MTPAQAWSLLASIRARLASVANFSVTFDNSNFGTFSSQTYIFGQTIGL